MKARFKQFLRDNEISEQFERNLLLRKSWNDEDSLESWLDYMPPRDYIICAFDWNLAGNKLMWEALNEEWEDIVTTEEAQP